MITGPSVLRRRLLLTVPGGLQVPACPAATRTVPLFRTGQWRGGAARMGGASGSAPARWRQWRLSAGRSAEVRPGAAHRGPGAGAGDKPPAPAPGPRCSAFGGGGVAEACVVRPGLRGGVALRRSGRLGLGTASPQPRRPPRPLPGRPFPRRVAEPLRRYPRFSGLSLTLFPSRLQHLPHPDGLLRDRTARASGPPASRCSRQPLLPRREESFSVALFGAARGTPAT